MQNSVGMAKNKMFLSIVMPAYNESNRIIPSLNNIANYFRNKKIKYEVIIVNDGSPDNTAEVVSNFCRKHREFRLMGYKKNRGKGYATKKGVLDAKGSYILFTDADLSAPIEEWENLFNWIKKGYGFAFGSRSLDIKKVKLKQPFYRRFFAFLAKVYAHYVIFTFTKPPKDTQCGFKMFTRKSAHFLFGKQRLDGGMFDTELIYLAKKFKIRAKEVPVVWINNPDSKINFIKCVMFDPIDLAKIRIWDMIGRYR